MIESHVVSLELSKRLKELGVKQKSYFYWSYWTDHAMAEQTDCCEKHWEVSDENGGNFGERYPAFLSSELGEMLPMTQPDESKNYACDRYFSVSIDEKEGKRIWSSQYDGSVFFEGGSMADAIAKMLIHLIEQGIIKV